MTWNGRSDQRWMLLFLVASLALAALKIRFTGQSAGVKEVAARKPIADMTLPQLGGGIWKLSEHRGQVVMINYWATWCEPCRDELPALIQVARESPPNGLAIVGVSLDSAPSVQATVSTVQQFVTLYHMPFPIAFPDAATNAESFDRVLPTTILIDRQGRIAKTYVGEVEHAMLAKDVAVLLAES